MGGELGGPVGEAPRFSPQCTRGPGGLPPSLGYGVQGDGDPGLQVHGVQGGPGACPRFGRLG